MSAFAAFFSWTGGLWGFAFILCLLSAVKRSAREAAGKEEKYTLHFALLSALLFGVIVQGLIVLALL